MKQKCIDFIKHRSENNYFYARLYRYDVTEQVEVILGDDEVSAIRQAIKDVDEEVAQDGGYQNDTERMNVHKEVITNLGIEKDYVEWLCDTPVDFTGVIHYVDIDDPHIFFSFKCTEHPYSHWVTFTDSEAGDFLLLLLENENLTLADLKTKNNTLYEMIVKSCGTNKLEFLKQTSLVKALRQYLQ